MSKVMHALAETGVIVLVVIFLFLGSVRATLIPAATIPVSILAAAIVMAALHYSINTLTLLGAVLAIGLVVDDAIVVLENIVRRIEHGEPPLLGAINGSREIGFAVIATTMVLVAVFLPISYMQGNVGRLFSEFGVTVAAAVVISALVALTLTPMMTARAVRRRHPSRPLRGGRGSRLPGSWRGSTTRRCAGRWPGRRPWLVLGCGRPVGGRGAVCCWCSAGRGRACGCRRSWPRRKIAARCASRSNGPEGASLDYMQRQLDQVAAVASGRSRARQCAARDLRAPAASRARRSVSSGMVFLPLKDWGERPDSAEQIAQRLRRSTQEHSRCAHLAQRGLARCAGRQRQAGADRAAGPEYGQLADVAERVMTAGGSQSRPGQPGHGLPGAPAATARAASIATRPPILACR